jgi:hypothetical protein
MDFEIVGPLAGGEVGATEVRDQDGRRLVLKRWPGGDEEGAALRGGSTSWSGSAAPATPRRGMSSPARSMVR